jgi:hypothetical protein
MSAGMSGTASQAIWSGTSTNPTAANFYVSHNGHMHAEDCHVRGNIAADRLKANTAMIKTGNIQNLAVDTLQIGDNAVTIPLGITRSFKAVGSGRTTLTSLYVPGTGQPSIVSFSALFHQPVIVEVYAGGTRLYRSQAIGGFDRAASWIRRFPRTHTGVRYYLHATAVYGAANAFRSTIFSLETKR